MPAKLLAQQKQVREDGSIVEIVLWELPEPMLPCQHSVEYRLYFSAAGACRVRYDNERGEADHRHIGEREGPYGFTTVEQLLADFEHDVRNWRPS